MLEAGFYEEYHQERQYFGAAVNASQWHYPMSEMRAALQRHAGFFTLSKRKGAPASFRLKTARLDRFHGGIGGRPGSAGGIVGAAQTPAAAGFERIITEAA